MSSTNFLNSSKRRIMQGVRGGFFSNSGDGKKVYGLKAHFRKVGANGAVTKIINKSAVPSPIRRAVRSNKGVTRGPREGKVRSLVSKFERLNREAGLPRRMVATKPKKVAAKSVMVFSPMGTIYKSRRSMLAIKKRAAM